jgi:hypothetical protein
MQPAALTVPRFVTLPAKPAAHTVQDVTEALPMAGVETPAGQGEQASGKPLDDHDPSAAERVSRAGAPK